MRTAQKWAHKFQNDVDFQRRYSTDRPPCSKRESDEAVRRVHEENQFRSANQIRAAAKFPGTSMTVMICFRDANIHCRRAASKESLKEGQPSTALPSQQVGGF